MQEVNAQAILTNPNKNIYDLLALPGKNTGRSYSRKEKWTLPSPDEIKPVELYEWQLANMQKVEERLDAGGNVIYTCATGGGKTECAIHICRDKKKILFIAPREILSIQSAKRFSRAGIPSKPVTKDDQWWKVGDGMPDGYRAVMATEGTAQTRWMALEPDIIVFDEAHHVFSGTDLAKKGMADLFVQNWMKAFEESKDLTQRERGSRLTQIRKNWGVGQAAGIALVARSMGIPVFGMTGTLWRLSDYEGFNDVWDHHISGPQVKDLVELEDPNTKKGYLTPLRSLIMGGRVRNLGIGTAAGREDYTNQQKERYFELNQARFTSEAIDWFLSVQDELGVKMKTIVYAINQASAKAIADYAREQGLRVGLMLSDVDLLTEYDERDETIKKFESGELDILVNVAIAVEGLDVRNIDCVLCVRPTQSLALWKQMCGRATRTAEGKEVGIVLDCTENSRYLGTPMESFEWSLFPRGPKGTGEMRWASCISEKCYAYMHPKKHYCPECSSLQVQWCVKCNSPERGLEEGSHCKRCLEGIAIAQQLQLEKDRAEQVQKEEEDRLKKIQEEAKKAAQQIKLGRNHEDYRFQTSKKKSPTRYEKRIFDCQIKIVSPDGTNEYVDMRLVQRKDDRWVGRWWTQKLLRDNDPEGWEYRTTDRHSGSTAACKELIGLVIDEFGDDSAIFPVGWQLRNATRDKLQKVEGDNG